MIASFAFAPRQGAVAGEPVEPGQHPSAAADVRPVTQLRVDPDRAVDRAEGVVDPGDHVGSVRQLLQRGRLLRRRKPLEEGRRAPVVGVRLPVRLQRRRSPRGDERVLGDDVLGARRFRVVDDVGRIGVGVPQGPEDLGMKTAPRSDREARQDRIPRQLVPEANVPGVDLEQLPPLRLLGRRGPVRHHRVQQRRGDAVRDDRDQLHEPPRSVVEPRRPPENRVRHRGRQLGRRCERRAAR